VTIANGKSYLCGIGETLLDAAIAQRVALEYSCKAGRCGVCKVRRISGDTELSHREESLTVTDVEAGYMLSCCRRALSDVVLDVEDIGRLSTIEAKTIPCRINALQRVTSDVLKVSLRTPPGNALRYLPGQHVSIVGREGARRSYSLANAPRPDGVLELHIRYISGGVMSSFWFNEARVNDLLRLEGPLGSFCLRDLHATTLIFLATGTGIAPVKAMLQEIAELPELVREKKLYVYWGVRKLGELYESMVFDGLEITFVPVLSSIDSGWNGRRGYVQEALVADGVPLQDAVIYACGSNEMIHSAQVLLRSSGLPERRFFSDAFVSSE
jgi:CDP-4-dehydro-6-deoxyglucose reductase, E3